MRGVLAAALVGLSAFAACDSKLDLGRSGEGGVAEQPLPTCESVCQKLALCGFVTPANGNACLAECRARATPAVLACAQSSACTEIEKCEQGGADAAFDSFNAALEAYEIGQCQQACSHLSFFECLTAAQHAACRSLCESAPRAKRASFESCANATSDCKRGRDCYDVFKTP